ncbi:MAG TPA: helix-turn-helix domain-containing protein, partial [Burkholderiaceae bacterium]|nr:helix-turn-helix domain-containing protein [Burkholderiaceae bacterium]
LAYAWPGNVRELEHVIGRAALRAAGRLEDRHHIVTLGLDLLGLEPAGLATASAAGAASAALPGATPAPQAPEARGPAGATLKEAMDATQRACVQGALSASDGNWAAAARRLGVDPSNLHKLARRLGVKVPQ